MMLTVLILSIFALNMFTESSCEPVWPSRIAYKQRKSRNHAGPRLSRPPLIRRYKSELPLVESHQIPDGVLFHDLADDETLELEPDYMLHDEPVDINNLVHGSLLNGKYLTLGVVGKGQCSIVTEALDYMNDLKVAVKIGFSIPIEESPTLIEYDNTRLQIFDSTREIENELRVYEILDGSCNTLPLLDSFQLKNATFLVFPYVPQTLFDYMYHHRPHDLSINTYKITQIAIQLFQALQCLHDRHLVHNDVKPENIMIDPQTMELNLIGFTQTCNENSNDWPAVIPTYEAPEITFNGRGETKSDIWSAGLLLAELVYGYPILPFLETVDRVYAIRELLGIDELPVEAELFNSLYRSEKFQSNIEKKLDRLMLTRDRHFKASTFLVEYKWSKMKHIRNVIKWCLQLDPNDRISAQQALQYLSQNIHIN